MKPCPEALLLAVAAAMSGCGGPWNDPYPASQREANVFYTSFNERPKHLDPVQSYSENEFALIANIYAPPLQYHYLKRPYELIPFAASEIPQPRYFDKIDQPLPQNASSQEIAYSMYEIRIRPGMRYQPHPALALDAAGKARYLNLPRDELEGKFELRDFKHQGTRAVVAADYVYQIKRLAHPRLHSPIFGLMNEYIVGLGEYAEKLKGLTKELPKDRYLDLNRFEIDGVKVIDEHTYQIRIKGKYPQFLYWLAMPFFCPIPVEADRFYSQPGMAEQNLNFDWYPLGSGPYMLTEHNPNRRMVLERNPYYMNDPYPSVGESEDAAAGLLTDAGKAMPFIERVVFSLEKESIPYWNKFLQGYYDVSGISSDNFDQVVELSGTGDVQLTPEMEKQGIRLQTSVAVSTVYTGFNMLDSVVGGNSERARKLRQAISLAIDQEESISIFRNGRGIPAQGPIPPGIFGHREGEAGINPHLYDWNNARPERKPIDQAIRLLAEAGYPDGIDRITGRPLMIYFDSTAAGAGAKASMDWLTKQFQKINLQLVVRSTDYNRFQEKIRKGTTQMYMWGWNADYPDPENFLFLFFGPQGKVKFTGENASNYSSPVFDRLFLRMRDMENGEQRQQVLDEMLRILQYDAPWIWGLHPKDYALTHQWVYNRKPNKIANNSLKYQRIDPVLREKLQSEWNQPVIWPLLALLAVVALAAWPAIAAYRRRERAAAVNMAG